MNNQNGQSRRTVLGGMAAGAGLVSMAAIGGTTAQAQPSLSKTFVLVHGAVPAAPARGRRAGLGTRA